MDRPWSAAALLSSCRGLIFRVVKDPVLDSALSHTAHRDGGQFDLKISRSKVMVCAASILFVLGGKPVHLSACCAPPASQTKNVEVGEQKRRPCHGTAFF